MAKVQTILHPTDFSACSETAFHVASSLAREGGGRLIVFHVAPTAVVYGGSFSNVPTDPRVYRHAFEKRLRHIQLLTWGEPSEESEEAAQPVVLEHRLREGDTAAEILRTAHDVAADLIVMGTHGRTGLKRMLMGSVAEAVLRGATCPVLTVKAPVSTEIPDTSHAAASVSS